VLAAVVVNVGIYGLGWSLTDASLVVSPALGPQDFEVDALKVALTTLAYFAPGDPLARFIQPNVRPEVLQRLREIYGLGRPFHEQFVIWIVNYVQVWDQHAWGVSITHQRPVMDMVGERLPPTLLLTGTALAITILIGIPLGLLAALKQYSIADKIVTTFATIGYAMPAFLLGIYLLYFGAFYLGWFPSRGLRSPPWEAGAGGPVDIQQLQVPIHELVHRRPGPGVTALVHFGEQPGPGLAGAAVRLVQQRGDGPAHPGWV
jgi:ABC-type dipeptide/oligopeptide/nickel transport system permease component